MAASPATTTRVAATTLTRWLTPSWRQMPSNCVPSLERLFICQAIKQLNPEIRVPQPAGPGENNPAGPGRLDSMIRRVSYLHPHEFLVGVQQFVSHFHHELEGNVGFLHCNDRLVQRYVVAGLQLVHRLRRPDLPGIDLSHHPAEHRPKRIVRRPGRRQRAGLFGWRNRQYGHQRLDGGKGRHFDRIQCLAMDRTCKAMARAFLTTAKLASKAREAAMRSAISSCTLTLGRATMPLASASGLPG